MPENTENAVVTPARRARRVRSQIRISRVSIERTARTLIVKLPIGAAQYLNITEDSKELFAVPINGVVQLSGFQPNIAIPVSRISAEDFVEHP